MKLGVWSWSSGDPVTYTNLQIEHDGDNSCTILELSTGEIYYGKWRTRVCGGVSYQFAHACMVRKGT